jgi:transposase InsO family protein
MSSPILVAPRDGLPFSVIVDASPFAVGGILEQQGKVVAFEYHKLSKGETRFTQYEKEFMGLLYCLRKWRQYLRGSKFTVYSDNSSLVQLLKTKQDPHHRIARWLEEYMMWSPDILHISGKSNRADVLSRLKLDANQDVPISDTEIAPGLEIADLGVTVDSLMTSRMLEESFDPRKDWPLIVADYLLTGEWLPNVEPDIMAKCTSNLKYFKFEDYKLIYNDDYHGVKGHYLPQAQRAATIARYHKGLGHLKADSIIPLIRRRFWFPNMAPAIKDFLKGCTVCQRTSGESRLRRNPPRPLDPSGLPFLRWGLDWVGPLPLSVGGNRYIITAIDYATRWVIARAVAEVNADIVAKFLYEDLVCNYGSPAEIVSDRANVFVGEILRQFMATQRIRHLVASSYHPQTNGMVERIHATLKRSLVALTEGESTRWDEFLSQALFSLRVREHAVTRYSPFYLLYGVEARLPGDDRPPESVFDKLTESEKELMVGRFIPRKFEVLESARGRAYDNSLWQQMRLRSRVADDSRKDELRLGQLVLRRDIDSKKMEYKWVGPYRIQSNPYPGVYYLLDEKTQKVFPNPANVAILKRFVENEFTQAGGRR